MSAELEDFKLGYMNLFATDISLIFCFFRLRPEFHNVKMFVWSRFPFFGKTNTHIGTKKIGI